MANTINKLAVQELPIALETLIALVVPTCCIANFTVVPTAVLKLAEITRKQKDADGTCLVEHGLLLC